MLARKILCLSLQAHDPTIEEKLCQAGWDVVCCSDLAEAPRLLAQRRFSVVLLVVAQAEILQESDIAQISACIQVSMHTEWVALLGAQALHLPTLRSLIVGSFVDYRSLPLEYCDVERMVEHAAQRALLRHGIDSAADSGSTCGMVGKSEAMVQLRRQIAKVAGASAPVLIRGESGSGKELAAQAIHASSLRKKGPLVEVNCGAIAPSLIHSELFGYVRGAFTGAFADRRGLIEAADGGTIFLDEIGDLPLELQASLLRFLQEKTIQRVGSVRSTPVDVRVVAASHMNLGDAVARGRFREDLFYRLNVLTIEVPPLRQRIQDVPLLARHFLRLCAADHSRRLDGFDQQALAAMAAYAWPGNVRELYNCVHRAVVMADQRWITPLDLGLETAVSAVSTDLGAARTVAELDAINSALTRADYNVTRAARELGVSRMTLYRLMGKHGLVSGATGAVLRT